MEAPSPHSSPSPRRPWRPATDKARAEHIQAARDILVRGRRDPVWFVERVLGQPLWERQREIIADVFSHHRVAVKAGHSVGKTYTAARAALAWFYLFPGASKVITTAPTWAQVSKLLWAEIGAVFARLPATFGGELLGTELRGHTRDHFAVGLSTDSAERFQGHHAEHLLVILDEAPGVRGEIWEAAESLRAGGRATLLAIGNPTTASGPFYDAFTSQRDLWQTRTISAFDSPNLAGLTPETLAALPEDELDRNPYPTLTTRRWVRERAQDWGVGSGLWQSRVVGEFPEDGDDTLIPLRLVEEACERRLEVPDDAEWQAGLDVAGPGSDETALVIRHGGRVVLLKAWAHADPRGDVLAALAPYRDRNLTVCVDSVGIGYYLGQHLRDQGGFLVLDVNVGRPATDKARYANWKAELYWGLRDRFREGSVELPRDARLISQLTSLRYAYNSRGLVQMESKDALARRGVRSPDRAEALMLAFASSNRLQLSRGALSSEILL